MVKTREIAVIMLHEQDRLFAHKSGQAYEALVSEARMEQLNMRVKRVGGKR